MGEQRRDQTDVEERPESGETYPSEAPAPLVDPVSGVAVIDLRAAHGDEPEPADAGLADPWPGQWERDRSGLRLRVAVSPTEQIDVRLPANFGSDDRVDWTPVPVDGGNRDGITTHPGEQEDDGEIGTVVDHLAVHAVEVSGWPTALARAVDLVEISRPTLIGRRASVGEVLTVALLDQREELLADEAGVRAGVGESIHRMRVASRRLRSLLATYRPWLTGSRGDRVRAELQRLAQDLGRARDADVLRARLTQEISVLPEELVVGPVMARVDRQLGARRQAALETIWGELDSEHFERLRKQLDRLVKDPPLSRQAKRRGSAVLGDRVRADGRRVRDAYAAYGRVENTARGEIYLHDVRKAAKRARYAAESASPVLGKPAVRMAKRMQAVQQILGDNQDSAAARLLIRHLVFQAHLAGENCFTFGLVYGMEMARASEARDSSESAIRAALSAAEELGRH